MERELEEALKVLGIPADSNLERATDAYRRLARVTHPDLCSDPDAAERFATATAAYRLVSASARSGPQPASDRLPQAGRTPLPFAVSPYLRTGVGNRPPIVAGPVRIRRPRGEAGGNA